MEDRRVGVVLGEQAQRAAERALAGHEHLAIAVDEERRGVAERLELLRAPDDVEHGVMVVVDGVRLEGEAAVLLDLVRGAEVDDRAQAEGLQPEDVGVGDAVDAVGPVEGLPLGGAAVGGRGIRPGHGS